MRGGDHARFYDLDYAIKLHHDPSIVGYSWDENAYLPIVYPPFYYIIVSPLAYLGYPIAMKVWAVLLALSLSLFGFLLHRYYAPCRQKFGVFMVAVRSWWPLVGGAARI